MSRKPSKTTGYRRLRALGVFVVATIRSWIGLPEEIGSPFIARQEALDGAIKAKDDAIDRRIEAQAHCNHKKHAVLAEVRLIGTAVTNAYGRTARSPLRALLFPGGLGALTHASPIVLLARVKELRGKLARGSVAESIAAHDATLEPLVADLEASVKAYDESVAAVESAKLLLKEERVRWLEAYDQLYHLLRAHFSSQPALADTFFLDAGRNRREDEEEVEVEAETAGPTNGTVPVATAPATTTS